MRTLTQALYRITLRAIGTIGVLFLIVFAMFAFGGADQRSFLHPLPIVALLTLIGSSLALAVFQHRLPDAIAAPSRPGHLAVLVPLAVVGAIVTPLAAMICMTAIPGPEDLMRPIAVGAGLIFILLYAAAGLLGTLLGLWPVPQTSLPEKAASLA